MFKDSHVTVIVSNLKNSLKFYVNTLGFEVKERLGDHWAEVGNDKITIGLHPAKIKPEPTQSMSIGLVVDDFDKVTNKLFKKGVKFMPDILEDEYNKIVFFKDPDGNPLYICQFKQSNLKS